MFRMMKHMGVLCDVSVDSDKVIIVEGLTDKRQLSKIISEQLEIICTNGTFGIGKFDELLEQYDLDNKHVFIFVDEDKSGIALRKELTKELPHAEHLYVSSDYREVAATPEHILAVALTAKYIAVDPKYLI